MGLLHRAAVGLLFGAAACGGGGSRCADGERSLAIVEPMDGASFTTADDVDPAMGGVQIELALAACGFEWDEQIGVFLLDPVESAYAYAQAGDDGLPRTIVPLLPGTLRMEARSMDGMVRSSVVTIHVTF